MKSCICTPQRLALVRQLRPMDDIFFRAMLHAGTYQENAELAAVLFEILEHRPLDLTEVETQKDMAEASGRKSICLDLFARDKGGNGYDCEVQNGKVDLKRMGYYCAVQYADMLKAGEDYDKLKTVTTHVITDARHISGSRKPLFGPDKPQVHLSLGGMHLVMTDVLYDGKGRLKDLMHDFRCTDPDQMRIPEMAAAAARVKQTKEGQEFMCELMEKLTREAELRGERRGERRGEKRGERRGEKRGMEMSQRQTAENLLKDGMTDTARIARLTGCSPTTVEALQKKLFS